MYGIFDEQIEIPLEIIGTIKHPSCRIKPRDVNGITLKHKIDSYFGSESLLG